MFLAQTIPVWNAANEHCEGLALNYKPFLEYDRVYILNIPTYYKGVAAYRSAFAETISLKNDYPAKNIRVIAGCYQESAADTITSVVIKENTVIVTSRQKKTPYFSTDGGWGRSYETDEYKVTFDPSGSSYTLHFKQEIPINSAFIYTSASNWKKAG